MAIMQNSLSAAPAIQSDPGKMAAAESTQSIENLLRHAPAAAQKILRALMTAQARHSLFFPEKPLVVAVSGGADSICLLHALHQLAPYWCLSLHIAHLDHALRPDSADDADFVAALAKEFSLPFYHKRLQPGTLDDAGGGLEEAARSARYAFLRQVAEQLSSDPATVATAHHQDDQAETLLLHLLQGSGLTGLAGMAWGGHIPDNRQPAIRLVRPLLGVNRSDIQAYLQSYQLPWREDSSNRNVAYVRNKIRHEVLPLLATINPNIHATLARTADLLAAEADHATERDGAALAAVTTQHTPSTHLVLNLFQLAQFDLATQRGVLRQALITLGIDLREVGMEGIELLLDQSRNLSQSGPHPLTAGWVWTVIQHAGTHHLSLHREDALPFIPEHPHLAAPIPSPLPVPPEGTLAHNHWQLQSSLLAPDKLPADWRDRNQRWRLFGDADHCGHLYLTTFKPGMSIAPLGMGGHRRALGDIFTDHKVPPALRAGWPVIVNDDGLVVWLCGLVVAEEVRVQPATRQVRCLCWQPEIQSEL